MDVPYIILLFVSLVLSYLEATKKNNIKYAQISIWIAFIFIAFRAPVVGADTWDYIQYLSGTRNYYNEDPRKLEFAFLAYRSVLSSLRAPYVFYMFVNTIISCFPIYLLIKYYSLNKSLSVCLFFLIGCHNIWFCALRQIIGIGILLFGVFYVMRHTNKKRWIVFVSCSILGYLFHTSVILNSVIYLIMFFVPIKNRKLPYIIIAASAITGVILKSFNVLSTFSSVLSLSLDVTSRLDNYLSSEVNEENSSLLFLLRMDIIGLMCFYFMDDDKINHWFSKIFLASIVLQNLFYQVPMFFRLNAGFSLFTIIVFTWIFGKKYYFRHINRRLANILVVIIIAYFCRSYILGNTEYDLRDTGRMHPYLFFFEDYSHHPSIIYF